MTPEIRILAPKQLIGMHLNMSFANNKTMELWKSFMPRLKEIPNKVSSELIALQTYPMEMDFTEQHFHTIFKKWAAVEVSEVNVIPESMEEFLLEGGLYAVFQYKGAPQQAEPFFRSIFGTWLPQSGYRLDPHRPHFEILGEKYKNNHPDSEEEIWIPVRI